MRFLTPALRSPNIRIVLACALCAGCGAGSEEYSYVAVSGTVTCNGDPVTGGTVTFWPTVPEEDEEYFSEEEDADEVPMVNPGRPAIAPIQNDGTYVLVTSTSEGVEDGAVAGLHRITIDHPSNDAAEDGEDMDELRDDWAGRKVGNPFLELLPCDPPTDLQVELTEEADHVINIEMSGGGTVTKVSPAPG